MNKILILFLILTSFQCVGQQFTKNEFSKLEKLDVNLEKYTFNNNSFNEDLKELLFFDKKRKQNKTWGYIFTGTGVSALALAVGLKSKNNGIADAFSSIFFTSAAISFGVSIPFHIKARKNRKKKEEKLIFIKEELQKLR